jgi:hypothetical protein
MIRFWRWTSASTSLLALGVTFATINPIIVSGQSSIPINTSPALAANLSDISSDYWASPFIKALATRNIISGFPDGTFRPNQPVSRAEFAAMIQSAFNQQPMRQISSQGFRDVPAGFWASSAIKEAYETGFMSGYPGNLFLPNQQIRKVEAIVALTTGLGLQTSDNSLGVVNTLLHRCFSNTKVCIG